jgi:hypothetical protein
MTATLVRRELQDQVDPWDPPEADEDLVASGPVRDRFGEISSRRDWDRRGSFDVLADELVDATSGYSSTRRAMAHPAFTEILALGDDAIPFLLERLEDPGNRPLWLRLLGSLTAYEPGAGAQTIPESAEIWQRWGRRRKYRVR